jgi:hypothetical protein
MLDDIDSKEGLIVIVPGPTPPTGQPPAQPPVAQPPAPGAAPPAGPTPPAQPAARTPPAVTVADVVRSVLATDVAVTPQATGPAAAAVDEIAAQCQKPVTEVQQAMRALGRQATLAKLQMASRDNKEKGAVYAIAIGPAAPLPDALSCITARPAEFKLDLLVIARDFGPMDAARVEADKQAQLELDLNASFGESANPWRLARAEELLAIVPVLLKENLWGPGEGMFWTAHPIAGGGQLAIETKRDSNAKDGYQASLIVADKNAKAMPIWVRNGK